MGVHTGDSITVAPIMTLSDREYQQMRDASFAILRSVGVDTGGANVQFAIHPGDGRMVVVEMKSACFTIVRAGLESHWVPDCTNCDQTGGRLHAR